MVPFVWNPREFGSAKVPRIIEIIASIVLVVAGYVQIGPGTRVLLKYDPGTRKYVFNTVPKVETAVLALQVAYVSHISITDGLIFCGPRNK